MGSGGSWIAQQVAKQLGFKYLDREILCQAAAMLQEDEQVLSGKEERVSSLWESIIQACCACVPETGYSPAPIYQVNNNELYDTESLIIKNAAEKCNCVIVGRGAWHILRNHQRLLTVFLHASKQYRAERISKIHGSFDRQSAETIVSDSDKQRRKFIREHADVEWTDASNYMLCIDTEAIGLSRTVDIIIEMSKSLSNQD